MGELKIDEYVTHTFDNLEEVNKAVDVLHEGACLRSVIHINKAPAKSLKPANIKVESSQKLFGGVLKTVSHWSYSNDCKMKFSIFLPEDAIPDQRGDKFPVVYFLSGLGCTHENAPQKSNFGQYAAKHRMAVVFPDTSPRDVEIEGAKDSFDFGESAGYYMDATTEKFKKNYNMYTYISQELPEVIKNHFHVCTKRSAITGFSMGGLGALSISLKNPGMFKSVSAFAPISSLSESNWGKKASEGYLGSVEAGAVYDPTSLIKGYEGSKIPMLVD